MSINNPIICAFDTDKFQQAEDFALKIKDDIGFIKLGLEFFCSNGPEKVKYIQDKYLPVFLDLKLHDIPNTVAKSLAAILRNISPAMTTLHLLNGSETIAKAVEVKKDLGSKSMLLGVTILTSHNDISDIGIDRKIADQVLFLAEIAAKNNLDGIVCSPQEISLIKDNFGDDLKLVVPGIRPENSSQGDQKRIATPKQALDLGADYIVIGRPITESDNPKATCKDILASI
jgi:orotidine-5'-phosphate decarboxylase